MVCFTSLLDLLTSGNCQGKLGTLKIVFVVLVDSGTLEKFCASACFSLSKDLVRKEKFKSKRHKHRKDPKFVKSVVLSVTGRRWRTRDLCRTAETQPVTSER